MKQGDFDFGQGKDKADSGMRKAENAARVREWQHEAGRWFMLLPVGMEITADDLAKAVGLPDQGTNKVNSVGAFFNGLANAKFIKWIYSQKDERVNRHAA
jgi:hypothetical protein